MSISVEKAIDSFQKYQKRLSPIVKTAQTALADPSKKGTLQAKYEFAKNLFKDSQADYKVVKFTGATETAIESLETLVTSVEDLYFEIHSAYLDLFKDDGGCVSSANVKLPPIELPTFSGNIQDYPAFIELFSSLIEKNVNLTTVEKFHYLCSSLKGEAFVLVKSLPKTASNYAVALQKLKDNYSNVRGEAYAYLDRIHRIKPMNSKSAKYLKVVLNTFLENYQAFNSMSLSEKERLNFLWLNVLLHKLDSETRERFEMSLTDTKIPSLDTLVDFLGVQLRALQNTYDDAELKSKCSSPFKSQQTFSKPQYKRDLNASLPSVCFTATSGSVKSTCDICKADHCLSKCKIFLDKSPKDRFNIVKGFRLCVNCLKSGHQTKGCTSQINCEICNGKHNNLLHFFKSEPNMVNRADGGMNEIVCSASSSDGPGTSGTVNNETVKTFTSSDVTPNNVLLATALVEVRDTFGNFHILRALLDSASQSSFITRQWTQKLGLKTRFPKSMAIEGLAGMNSVDSIGRVELVIRPVKKLHPQFQIEASILNKICSQMPNTLLLCENWKRIHELPLADPKFNVPDRIDILLGAAIFPLILKDGRILGDAMPPAINTVFGWVLMGDVDSSCTMNNVQSFHTVLNSSNMEFPLQKFWELEELPQVDSKLMSEEENRAEQMFCEEYYRDDAGRFVVPLLMKDEIDKFENSFAIALRKFYALERRLLSDNSLYQQYNNFLREYLFEGHMDRIAGSIDKNDGYYIPHHCILRPTSQTTKLRVVFNASSKCLNGVSLNDVLYVGPKLQSDICRLLLRFRIHHIVFIADMKQMYRQILIIPKYRKFQRIIWRWNPTETPQVFELNTVTYGESSAPFLALRVMSQLAKDGCKDFPQASHILSEDIYVDDIVSGCSTKEEALKLKTDLINLSNSAGFTLHKWASNCHTLVDEVNDKEEHQNLTFDKDTHLIVKVLGLYWKPTPDYFSYNVTVVDGPCTKRVILSELAKTFDPLGFISPVTIIAKYVLQQLWEAGIGWDDRVPQTIADQWTKYKQELSCLTHVKIPRRVLVEDYESCELHGFCDASETGYAAVIYFRVLKGDKISTFFVCAKSKVAPLKRLTLPRLELSAAVLLANLIDFVKSTLNGHVKFKSISAWSDSSVTLSWIKSSPNRWKTFVGNRVAQIQEKVPPDAWRHVRTFDNPADCGSRGMYGKTFVDNCLWWAGPHWLLNPEDSWPPSFNVKEMSEVEEMKCASFLIEISDNLLLKRLMDNFSSFRKIRAVVAYCLRFVHNLREESKLTGSLKLIELEKALLVLVKMAQSEYFGDVISDLRNNRTCSRQIRKLSPFLDERGLIRVGGRLRHAQLPFGMKHPLLLSREHMLTDLIIKHYHEMYLHPGFQQLHFLLMQRFWILGARRAIKQIVSRCYRCWRVSPTSPTPLMGNLPAARVSQLKAFSHVGTDMAGPFTISLGRYRGSKTSKAYICIFVCMAVKAIHLELVSALTTDAFLAAFRRFVARRGRCTDIYSDCGTNFVGANGQLLSYSQAAAETCAIQWHFNAPSSPHFGGLWEAGVKSVKSHIRRVVGDQIMTYEEFATLLAQIESVLNSRPLYAASTDPNDLTALTPGHFLTLEPLSAPPDEYGLEHLKINTLNRWQLLQRCHQHFWRRWQKEYLNTLQQRQKWNTPTQSPKIGDLVLIKQDNNPPLQWPLGRIIELYPGSDDIVRVVKLKTIHGELKRPVVKLCPLPYYQEN